MHAFTGLADGTHIRIRPHHSFGPLEGQSGNEPYQKKHYYSYKKRGNNYWLNTQV